jgi:PAS domain S-box-containing protein
MPQQDAPVAGRRSTASVASDSSQPRVLLVDDQPARLLTYEAVLSGVGVTCVKATSGVEALERLLRDTFAVILLDVSMPGMDGFETARRIREHPRFERTPIIFVTGVHVSELDALRGYEVGAIDYIPVPIVPEILRSKVALLVELYKRRSELESLNRDLEQTRRDRDEHYRAIFEHPSELTVVFEAERDAEGTIFDWRYRDVNSNALTFLGRTRDEVLGQRISEIMPERSPHLIKTWARVLDDRKPLTYEASFGSSTFMLSLFPIGENAIVTSGVDITARTKAEQEVQRQFDANRAEKEWLTAVLNSMNEEVYFTDTQQRYTYANPAALREFGHENVEGVSVGAIVSGLEVFRPDGTPRPIEEAPPLRALAGEIVRDEGQIVRVPRTGELRHRQVSSAPVRDASGEIIGSVSVVRDVTEQMRDAQLLRDADRRKDEFIAVLAHELRNPLVPIRTGVELLRSSRSRPELIDTIWPMMERQVGHMVRLIDDLLDVSRITSGKIELQRQRVTLGSVVGIAIEANRDAINTRGLELVVNLSDPHSVIDVDPTRFAQVISNLLQNAAKFTQTGGRITLTAGLEALSVAHLPELVVKVLDTGIGISAEMLPRVFDLFAQSDVRGHGASHSGLGIGLALARRLIELHGGEIRAHSDGAGHGSEFTLRVPAPGVDNAGDDACAQAARTLDGIRVMVIDDNRDAADMMGMLVSGMGGEAHVVYDGPSALDSFRGFHASVVLLDLGMPGMDGYETCRRLRRQFGSGIGIVALTGWGQESDRQLTHQAGFDAHLTKPAEPAKLEEVIRSLANAR